MIDPGTLTEGLALDLADIQGFVLRGYRMPMARHFLLTVSDSGRSAPTAGRLVSGDESDLRRSRPRRTGT